MEQLDHAALQLIARALCANAKVAMMAGANAAVIAAYLGMSESERKADPNFMLSLFEAGDFETVTVDFGVDLLDVREALGEENAFLPDSVLAAIAAAKVN